MTTRKILFELMALAMCAGMASCVSDDTDLADIIAGYQEESVSIELDYSALEEPADAVVTDVNDSAYNDYVENTEWDKIVNITFNGNEARVDGSVKGLIVNAAGAHLTIMNMAGPVLFVVSGVTANGSLKFYGDKRFQVLMNGADITNPHGAAINNQGGKSMYVALAEGTVNRLCDGETYAMVDLEDQKAALFSEGQIIFSGKGTLNVQAVGRGGIRSDDYIRIRPGVKINVSSTALDGLRANDGIIIDGGVINIETTGVGAKGVRSEGPMCVNGGRLTAISRGDARVTTDELGTDTASCAALHCDTLLHVTAGTLRLKATGDGGKGLNAQGHVVIDGGNLTAVAEGTKLVKKPKGVKIDGNFVVNGGCFYTYSRRSDPLDVAGRAVIRAGYKSYDVKPKSVTIVY